MRRPPSGRCSARPRRAARTADKGSAVALVVAKAPAQVAVPNVVGQDEATAIDTLTKAGFDVNEQQVDVTDEGQDGTVVQQDPSGGKAKPGAKVTIGVGSFTPPPETNPATRRRHAVRIAVLAGGRSSEHDVSLASGASVREGLLRAGHEVAVGRAGPRRHVASRRRRAGAAAGPRAARRGRGVPGAARPVRRGRNGPGPARAARRRRTSARACWRPPRAWTRSSSRT